MQDDPVRLIAFYLPQYYPISQNDAWWGKGFTEWTNVAQARPLFPAHYQPHTPADLGFYDLRLPETRQAQADLAREYGIYGFCYYHYWFGGARLLGYPFDQVLASGKPDFPFCLCWANEPWTRAWDGRSGDVLMPQNYSEEDDLNHIRWLATAFRDPRYIRIGDKPMLLVYRANQLPNALRTTTIWREEARRLGVDELFLGRVESFPDEFSDPHEKGFDAAVEFQPNGSNLTPKLPDPIYRDHEVFAYRAFMEKQLIRPDPPYRRFLGVMPGWDNSPRRPTGARIFVGSNPELYEKWLRAAIQKAAEPNGGPGENFVFINAWNEWGEGNHLEPDLVFGLRYLEATRRALLNGPHPGVGAPGGEPNPTAGFRGGENGSGLGRGGSETRLEEENDSLRLANQDLERMINGLRNTVYEQQAVIDRQQATVHAYVELERWAHELENTARQQQDTIRTYQLVLRAFSPFIRLARAMRLIPTARISLPTKNRRRGARVEPPAH